MLKRRQFIGRVGKTAGLVLLTGTLKSVLGGCTPAVESTNETPINSMADPIPVSSADLLTPGILQWGAESDNGAPYVFFDPEDSSELIGFEVEIAKAIAQLMGVTSEFRDTPYPELANALAANRFDLILNGWEVTSDREQTQLFSQPYYRYGQQIVVRADDPRFADANQDSELTLKDLAGMTVGTGAGYRAEKILTQDPQITLRSYVGELPFDDLAQGAIDAVLIDYPIVAYYVLGTGPGSARNTALKPIGVPIFLNNYVIAFNKNNPQASALQTEVDEAIARLKQDGTLKDIYKNWNLWNEQQAEIGIV
ncbi:ABC transporter substrate-binding protein [Candidatus Synechococcus calcipolaris G9]|uniref:ABC transporter substrate-binding protein n=1 Tax=Candidatus Synechococcus calcipolaris G9 TaxID=1497997 RepID=A0ABT6EVP2_9SYNE|nr:ABC transporter substrate-binding protein [Candidatus Synechococcus calcipolaris]MDG2989862.1 ABC transporter substrate-binding protein [Candidatus Synechococcus calcipolaris G9]